MLFLIIELIFVVFSPIVIEDYAWFLYMSPYYRILDFILGMLVAKLFIENKDYASHKRLYYGGCEVICILLFGCVYLLSFILPAQYTRGFIYTPIFLVSIYYFSLEKGVFKRFLSSEFFQLIAKYSFEFYMVHELILIFFRKIFVDVECSYLVKLFLISFPALIVSSILAYIIKKINLNQIWDFSKREMRLQKRSE